MWFTILDPRIYGSSHRNVPAVPPKAISSIHPFRPPISKAQLHSQSLMVMDQMPKDIMDLISSLLAEQPFDRASILQQVSPRIYYLPPWTVSWVLVFRH